MIRHILLIRRYRIHFFIAQQNVKLEIYFFVESQNKLWSLCYKKLLSLLTNLKRALRIPIIVYRRNVRLMDIQDKSTGLSKMPLNNVRDENIEQDNISH